MKGQKLLSQPQAIEDSEIRLTQSSHDEGSVLARALTGDQKMQWSPFQSTT